MKMLKVLSCLMTFGFIFALAGCNGNDQDVLRIGLALD